MKKIKLEKVGLEIDWSGLDDFRNKLPIDGELNFQNEYYRFLILGWDIVKAQYLLSKIPHETHEVNVERCMDVLGLPRERMDMSLFYIDEKRVMDEKIDLTKPLIVAYVVEGKTEGNHLIDGLHRIVKAYRTGVKKLPAYFLSHEEEQSCRI